MVLKPAAISIFCSFAVGVLLAQPTARASPTSPIQVPKREFLMSFAL
jgi:hypothetical protein